MVKKDAANNNNRWGEIHLYPLSGIHTNTKNTLQKKKTKIPTVLDPEETFKKYFLMTPSPGPPFQQRTLTSKQFTEKLDT